MGRNYHLKLRLIVLVVIGCGVAGLWFFTEVGDILWIGTAFAVVITLLVQLPQPKITAENSERFGVAVDDQSKLDAIDRMADEQKRAQERQKHW